MDRHVEEADVNRVEMTGTSDANRAGRATPRAPMAVRVLVAVLAAACMLAAAWAGAVAVSVHRYDEATASLTANLQAASRDDADLDRLAASQRRTDSMFADARRMEALLPGSVSAPLATNADVSSRLTALIDATLAARDGGSDDAGATQDQSQGVNGAQEEQGLSEEQRAQVDELLNTNRELAPSASASPTASQGTTQTSAPGEQSGAKPW